MALCYLRLDGHYGDVTSLAFSLDGKTIISRSGDDAIIFWQVP